MSLSGPVPRLRFGGLGRDLNLLLIWYALELSDSYAAVGFLVFLRFAPYALLGLVCGWLSDRLDRRRLIVGADVFRAILLVAAAGLLLAGEAPLVVLGVTAFLLTAARTLFQPAVQGLLPQLAQGPVLIRANAVLHGAVETVGVAAPVLGGLLLGALVIPSHLALVLLIGFVLGAAGAIADILFATLVQERMPGEHVSKTFAGFSTLANTAEAVSAPALGLLAGLWGIGAAFAAGAALPIIAALVGLLWLSGQARIQER